MKKKFGQNFLINNRLINEIIEFSSINNNSIVYEIGPGNGALTKKIIEKKPSKLIAVEIDPDLKNDLDPLFNKKNYVLIYKDALKIDELSIFEKNTVVISNLPYNISVKLLFKWLHQYLTKPWIGKMILMFQKEVADRILSEHSSKNYGRISIITSAIFEVKKIIDVNRENFFPKPNVDSCVLLFTPLKKPLFCRKNINKLEKVTKILFSNRRKKNKNKITSLFDEKTIKNNNLDQYFDQRAENLEKKTFFSFAKILD